MQRKEYKEIKLSDIIRPIKPARDNIAEAAITELAYSMKKLGLLQPIIVTKIDNKYEIEAGDRRYLAAIQLGWVSISASIIKVDDNQKMHLQRAHENLIRENLNPVEEARACKTLVYEEDRGTEKAALLLSKSRAWVEQRLDILTFPNDLLEALSSGRTSIAICNVLSTVKDDDKRKELLTAAIEYGASARIIKQWIDDSSVSAALTSTENAELLSRQVSIDIGVTQMECFICQVVQPMSGLKHIWVDHACLGFVIETAKVAQEEIAKGSE